MLTAGEIKPAPERGSVRDADGLVGPVGQAATA